MNRLRSKVLVLVLLAGLYTASGSLSPLAAQEPQHQGVFGIVAETLVSPTGLSVITLVTTEGEAELLATLETAIFIPGRETASIEDISVGDFLVVLAKRVEQQLEAEKILLKPTRPVHTAHITGVVVASADDSLVIVNGEGHQLALTLGADAKPASPGDVVTAVVKQDIASGSLSAQDAEAADKNMKRLQGAIDRATSQGLTANLENLKARLVDSTTAHLTVLQRVLQQVPAPAQAAINTALQRSTKGYQSVLASLDLGQPLARIDGVVEVVDPTQRLILITPKRGEAVELLITDETQILLRGREAGFEQLQVGHRVEATYGAEIGEGKLIKILLGETIQPGRAKDLLGLLEEGEVEGRASAVLPNTTPPRLTLLTESGDTLSLTITPQTRIKDREATVSLSDIVPNTPLKVLYNASNRQAIQIETFPEVPGEAFLQGIVQSINRKTRELNAILSVRKTISLTITSSTIIERDGRTITISEVKLGDLIRPTTRYDTTTLELGRLALKSAPPLQVEGIIRGKVSADRVDSLTITTHSLDLITLHITDDTQIQRQGEVAAFRDLELGERVVAGIYSPVTLKAIQLVVQAAKTLQIRGIITALDADLLTVTITAENGKPITLILSKRSRITRKGNTEATFQSLRLEDEVRLAFYRASTKEVVRLVII